jgi:ubiquitin carboxyl-terminal hydrolase 10
VSEPVATPTPQTSDAPSDTASTQPTTPSSVNMPQPAKVQQTPTQPRNRPVLPVIPAIPILPTSPTTPRRVHRDSVLSTTSKISANLRSVDETEQRRASNVSLPTNNLPPPEGLQEVSKPAFNPAPPKSWADLVRSKAPSTQNSSNTSAQVLNGLGPAKSESLSNVLNSLSPNFGKSDSKIAFLKPRGLVNTGMLCYMNSVSTDHRTVIDHC